MRKIGLAIAAVVALNGHDLKESYGLTALV